MRTGLCQTAITVLMAVASAPAPGQGRPLRLFLSPLGLSDPSNVQSPAVNPAPTLGINPSLTIAPNQAARLYVWAQINPPGAPNNVTYNTAFLRARVTGAGGAVAGFQFWNYTNGSYGNNTGRWQSIVQYGEPTTAYLDAAAVTTGAGINNTNTANTFDAQHRRFATDGTTRIDCTLLGWVEFTASQPGASLSVFLNGRRPPSPIPPEPQPRLYLGWGDEGFEPPPDCPNCDSPIPEATIVVTPEPASLVLLAGLVLLRPCRSTAFTARPGK